MRFERLFVFMFFATSLALPVKKSKEPVTAAPNAPNMETALEYERYLKEVVEALESDPEFRKKLDKAPEADIRSGKIAQELDYVNHHVRNKLDEIKRRELERLRSFANREFELENSIDRTHLKIPQHLDHGNEHTFEIEDLRKLIKKTSEDLAEADQQRRAEFKEYEMQKEFERDTKMKEMDEQHRIQYEEDLKKQQEKHQKHEKLHHPGNKAQLEDVWEKQDHLDKQEFDPHKFFMIHDIDSNGFWDETEVKALFVKELDKVYQSGLPEDDMRERAEEMERMREHVFKETDTNLDGLISFNEFLEQTKRDEFNKDPEWETVDEQPQYTHEEYLQFERRRQEEIQRMIADGLLPPHPNMQQNHFPNHPQEVQNLQQNEYQQVHNPQSVHNGPQNPQHQQIHYPQSVQNGQTNPHKPQVHNLQDGQSGQQQNQQYLQDHKPPSNYNAQQNIPEQQKAHNIPIDNPQNPQQNSADKNLHMDNTLHQPSNKIQNVNTNNQNSPTQQVLQSQQNPHPQQHDNINQKLSDDHR